MEIITHVTKPLDTGPILASGKWGTYHSSDPTLPGPGASCDPCIIKPMFLDGPKSKTPGSNGGGSAIKQWMDGPSIKEWSIKHL